MADEPCVVDIKKPRDTTLDVTVRDDVSERGDDVIVIDSVYDAGTADRLYVVKYWQVAAVLVARGRTAAASVGISIKMSTLGKPCHVLPPPQCR